MWATAAETIPAEAVPFRDGREHLEEALRHLDLRLRQLVIEQRDDPGVAAFNEYRGHYVADDEVDLWCRAAAGGEAASRPGAVDVRPLAEAAARAGERLAARAAAARDAGVRLPLAELAERFDLTPFDVDALLVCLAPELDLRYETLYAFLHNNVRRKRPTVDLVLRLACRDAGERLQARARLTAAAPLLAQELLAYDERSVEEPVFLARSLAIDEAVVHYLLELDLPDPRLGDAVRWLAPRRGAPAFAGAGVSPLSRLYRERSDRPPHYALVASAGADALAAVRELATAAGLDLLVAATPRLLGGGDGAARLRRVLRHARLHGAAVFFADAEALGAEESPEVHLAGHPLPVFLAGERPWPAGLGGVTPVELPAPGLAQRRALWRAAAAGFELAPGVDLDLFADRYRLRAGQVRRALAAAREQALLAGRREIGAAALHRACRGPSQRRLAEVGRLVEPVHGWDDIVLKPGQLTHLREICAHVRQHRRVFDEWGLRRKIPRGHGVSALFAGPPGTGKTLAAEIIAGELELELYKIDLAAVVSKYIGETEKNLSRIFAAAAECPVLLFFDEADALFGKRTQVKDAHDRYANIEINYLLQRLEEHPGPVILASNLRKNIDEAFVRRLRFIVELPLPGEDERRRIWRGLLEPLPRAADLDLDFLARQFRIAGGDIRNAVVGAAFLAAAEERPVAMVDLVRALGRELEKGGRLCVQAEFGHYFDLLVRGGER